MEIVEKPWGTYESIIEESYCKVKKIVVKPNEAPSYQYHHKRSEIWIVVKGAGVVKIDDVESECSVGSVIVVPTLAKHQVRNTGNDDLVFVEVQLGESFEESDIVRINDKYGRV